MELTSRYHSVRRPPNSFAAANSDRHLANCDMRHYEQTAAAAKDRRFVESLLEGSVSSLLFNSDNFRKEKSMKKLVLGVVLLAGLAALAVTTPSTDAAAACGSAAVLN
jgi:hypothetical protein